MRVKMDAEHKVLVPWFLVALLFGGLMFVTFLLISATGDLDKSEAVLMETQDNIKKIAKEKDAAEHKQYAAEKSAETSLEALRESTRKRWECEDRVPKFLAGFSSSECCLRFSQCVDAADKFFKGVEPIFQKYELPAEPPADMKEER
jgi:hypothetical protein